MAKLAVRGDEVAEFGVSDEAERLAWFKILDDPGAPWSLKPRQPSAFQPLLIPVRGAGRAVTGRIFLRRGVCSTPSASVSVSLSLGAEVANGKDDGWGKIAGVTVEPSDGL